MNAAKAAFDGWGTTLSERALALLKLADAIDHTEVKHVMVSLVLTSGA